ncbi:MAG: ArsR family transcriptional regulator [archaeon]
MTGADDRILEFFAEHQIALTPAVLTYHLDYTRTHINTRMRVLSEHGLLEDIEEIRGLYKITDRGMAYLGGELGVKDLEEQ